jgi:hypothetical protein
MKKIILVVMFFNICHVLFSQNAYQATLCFVDGSIKTGFAQVVNADSKFVIYKENESGKNEKIKSSELKRITYTNDGDSLEFDNIHVMVGLKQNKIKGPYWLKVVKRGYASLYTVRTYMSSGGSSVGFTDYYIIREGEQGAQQISSVAAAGSNNVFRSKAPKYFADFPQLAQKIKDKEYKYSDIETVLDIYNEWIESKRD